MALSKEQEKLISSIMDSIEERCHTKDEIEASVYVVLDTLYSLFSYSYYYDNFYTAIANEVERQIEEKYDIMII